MKISLNWIKDFVDLDPRIANEELAATITLSVCEVEGHWETGAHLKQILAAEATDIAPHPDAGKLSLTTVNYGAGEETVVCGASNFKVGDKVPLAREGTLLPNGLRIKKTSIRGIDSSAMLCAEDELGFSEDHEGLMILPPETAPGVSLGQIYPDQLDLILEIDNKSVTHRPDLWGHYGFAMELGAIYRRSVKKLDADLEKISGAGKRLVEVEVLAKESVPRFFGASLGGVVVKKSPDLIRHRLSRLGLRPINNIVDAGNYVMLELGQPMHAFDADKIVGQKLIVKFADRGTKIMTLHGKEIELGEKDMTICDLNEALVAAGIVGGETSGVSESSNAIFLEAANWDPTSVRKTSSAIGMRTDSCQRFEKALDPEMTPLAVQKAVEIIKLTSPDLKIHGSPVDIKKPAYPPITIKTSTDFINRRLGKKIEDREIRDILERLGFKLEMDGSELIAEVPSHRRTKDISIAEDLVEEIGRIHGFNNIPPQSPLSPIKKTRINRERQLERQIKTVLADNKYQEVYNYPLTDQKTEDLFGLQSEGIMKLLNPEADHQNQMRTSLLPHFSQTIFENQKTSSNFKIFEIGRTYRKNSSQSAKELSVLIMGVSQVKKELGGAFYSLKSDLTNLLNILRVPSVTWKPSDNFAVQYRHSNISASIESGDVRIGEIFSFSPEYMDKLELKEDICLAELDMDKIHAVKKAKLRYKEPEKYPSATFELSLVTPKRVYYEEISRLIYSAHPLVKKTEFLEVYFPEKYPEQKSISVGIELSSPNKTLNSEEVKDIQDRVINSLTQRYKLRD